MAKRIHMTQQRPFDYMPLRAGLGLIDQHALEEYVRDKQKTLVQGRMFKSESQFPTLCPKIYTTHTRPLQGEYIVVEGSRYKAHPVEPEIRFRTRPEFDFTWNEHITPEHFHAILGQGDLTYPELDLGIKGTDYWSLRNLLLAAYPQATNDTRWYVSRLEPLGAC